VYVRALHAVPKAPAVDVWVAGVGKAISGLEFTKESEYLKVPAGTYHFAVTVSSSNATVLDLPNIRLLDDYTPYYTIVAENKPNDLNSIIAVVGPSPRLPELRPGECATRFVHLSPDAPPVTLWVDGKVDAREVHYDEAFPLFHIPVRAGSAVVSLSVAGSNPPKIVFNASIPCPTGTYQTVAAMGSVAATGSEGLQGVVLKDNEPAL
jgi:hypothetical protein